MLRSCLLAAPAVALLFTVVTAAPAAAHGGGGDDATNYASEVRGLVEAGSRQPVTAAGLRWEVIAGDALLSLSNTTGDEVVVEGYEGEPYLRIGPDGVFRNRASPATYLNQERYGRLTVPPEADAAAEPRWVRIADGPAFAWHDHRIHWMATTDPPAVKLDPGRRAEVLDWSVPFSAGGRQLAVTGTLTYVPPPPWPPWLAAGLAVTSAPLVAAALRNRGGTPAPSGRRTALARGAAAGIASAAVLAIVVGIDDLVSVPATGAEQALLAVRIALVTLPALLGAALVRRARPAGTFALAAGGAVLFAGSLGGALAVLTSSQVASSLPEAVTRVSAAADLAVVVPVVVAAGLALTERRARGEGVRGPDADRSAAAVGASSRTQ